MQGRKMQTTTITLPAYWASALINGDYSGLDDDDAARCSAEERRLARKGWAIVSCNDEARFTWSYGLYDAGANCSGGEVLDYHCIRPATRRR